MCMLLLKMLNWCRPIAVLCQWQKYVQEQEPRAVCLYCSSGQFISNRYQAAYGFFVLFQLSVLIFLFFFGGGGEVTDEAPGLSTIPHISCLQLLGERKFKAYAESKACFYSYQTYIYHYWTAGFWVSIFVTAVSGLLYPGWGSVWLTTSQLPQSVKHNYLQWKSWKEMSLQKHAKHAATILCR